MRLHRTMLVLMCVGPPFLGGCATNEELNDARLQADECRLELEELRSQQAGEDVGRLKAQRDRLAAENRMLTEEVTRLKDKQRALDGKLAAAEKTGPQLARELDTQRKELEVAIANVGRSRQQWEDTLADRQRQIEVLSNRLERLQQELAALRPATRPASRPAGG